MPEAHSPALLSDGDNLNSEISGTQTVVYEIKLERGEFVRIDFIAMGASLVVDVTDPGRQAQEWHVATGFPQPVTWISDRSGSYRVQVRLFRNKRTAQRFSLRVMSHDTATSQARQYIAASQTLSNATDLCRGETSASQQKCIGRYHEALGIWRSLKEEPQSAFVLCRIGDAHMLLSEYDKALGAYVQARLLPGGVQAKARILNSIGRVHLNKGDNQKALDLFMEALEISRSTGDLWSESLSLYNIGKAYHATDRLREALEYLNKALLLNKQLHDDVGEADTLLLLGYSHHAQKEVQVARERYEQALNLCKEIENIFGQADAMAALGHLMTITGEWQQALAHYHDAMHFFEIMGNRTQQSIVLQGIAYAYSAMGEKTKGLELYQQSAAIARELKNKSIECSTLLHMAELYRQLGNFNEVFRICERALYLNQTLSSPFVDSSALATMGKVLEQKGDLGKADDYYQRALGFCRKAKDRFFEAYLLDALGHIYYVKGEHRKALEYFGEALNLQRAAEDPIGSSRTLYNKALAERALGNFEAALVDLGDSLKSAESLRTHAPGTEFRASYQASVLEIHKSAIDLLMQSHRIHPSSGFDARALQANEQARARTLLESLNEARADIREGVDPSLLEQERALQQSLSAKAELQISLLRSNHTNEDAAALSKEISALSAKYEEVQAVIRSKSPRYAALTQPQPLNLEEIYQQVLDPDTLLLEYSLGDERSFLWAVTDTSIHSYELPKRAEIEKATRRVNELLLATQSQTGKLPGRKRQRAKDIEAQFWQEARNLSRILLDPAKDLLGTKRLLIVAEGGLQYLPFSMLPEPAREADDTRPAGADEIAPLILGHEVVNLPSASVLAVLRREIRNRPVPPKAVAVLADPVFEKDDPRVNNNAFGGPRASKTPAAASGKGRPYSQAPSDPAVKLRRAFREIGLQQEALSIPRLPATRQEAEGILAIAPAGSGFMALDFQASRSTAMSLEISQYRIVHFATHGLIDNEHPEFSGLVLSLIDEQGRPQNGFLRLGDIYNLNLPIELVVLSACNSGLGKDVRGEGLVGIVRGFMYAGAARVISSLWKVEDEATAELMKRFYQQMLLEGKPPAAALRAAQVGMWQHRRWRNPYFWAAFTLQGEWR